MENEILMQLLDKIDEVKDKVSEVDTKVAVLSVRSEERHLQNEERFSKIEKSLENVFWNRLVRAWLWLFSKEAIIFWIIFLPMLNFILTVCGLPPIAILDILIKFLAP